MPYVYSKLSAHVDYAEHAANPMGASVVKRVVTIKGRADVMNELPNGGLETPRGVATRVTDDELAVLERNGVFQIHKQNGFIEVSDSEISVEKAIADMQKKDNSAPLTPGDYENTVPLVSGDKNENLEKGKVIGAIPDDVAKKRKNQ